MKKQTVLPGQARFNAILNSRNEVNLGHAGEVVRATITGKPNIGFWDERIVNPSTGEVGALKDLYSFNISKGNVLDSKFFLEAEAKAIALEAAGQEAEATALYNDLLNKSQLSFGQINRDGSKPTFASGQIVELALGVVDVEEKDSNGNPTGTSHKSIVVTSIAPVKATMLTKGRKRGADVEEETPVAANVPVGQVVAPE